ncbi:hypothetical protein Hanom_Chr11g01047671 [Helianthus anomalus]
MYKQHSLLDNPMQCNVAVVSTTETALPTRFQLVSNCIMHLNLSSLSSLFLTLSAHHSPNVCPLPSGPCHNPHQLRRES